MYVTNAEHYKQVQSLNLSLSPNETWRGDCPICNAANTFTVTSRNGNLLWHCYSASCKSKGAAKQELTPSTITAVVNSRKEQEVTPPVYKPEARFQEPFRATISQRFMGQYDLGNFVRDGRIRAMYDPLSKRFVFLVHNSNVCYDAVGRALDITGTGETTFKKWYRYGNSGYGLLVRKNGKYNDVLGKNCSDLLILTEDAISACVVANQGSSDAMALLGTNLTDRQITQMLPYKQVMICLDPDARVIAQALCKRIAMVRPCIVASIKDDLKYGRPEDIAKVTVH